MVAREGHTANLPPGLRDSTPMSAHQPSSSPGLAFDSRYLEASDTHMRPVRYLSQPPQLMRQSPRSSSRSASATVQFSQHLDYASDDMDLDSGDTSPDGHDAGWSDEVYTPVQRAVPSQIPRLAPQTTRSRPQTCTTDHDDLATGLQSRAASVEPRQYPNLEHESLPTHLPNSANPSNNTASLVNNDPVRHTAPVNLSPTILAYIQAFMQRANMDSVTHHANVESVVPHQNMESIMQHAIVDPVIQKPNVVDSIHSGVIRHPPMSAGDSTRRRMAVKEEYETNNIHVVKPSSHRFASSDLNSPFQTQRSDRHSDDLISLQEYSPDTSNGNFTHAGLPNPRRASPFMSARSITRSQQQSNEDTTTPTVVNHYCNVPTTPASRSRDCPYPFDAALQDFPYMNSTDQDHEDAVPSPFQSPTAYRQSQLGAFKPNMSRNYHPDHSATATPRSTTHRPSSSSPLTETHRPTDGSRLPQSDITHTDTDRRHASPFHGKTAATYDEGNITTSSPGQKKSEPHRLRDGDNLCQVLSRTFQEVQGSCQQGEFGSAVLGLSRMMAAVVMQQEQND